MPRGGKKDELIQDKAPPLYKVKEHQEFQETQGRRQIRLYSPCAGQSGNQGLITGLYLKKSLISCLITGLLIASIPLKNPAFAASDGINIDNLSEDAAANGIPRGWQIAWFDFCPRRTIYTVENEKGKRVLKASSRNSASAIYREVSIDPKVFPILTWRWKVSNIIKKGNERAKEGDDYSARLYVSFEFRPGNISLAETLKRRMVKAVYGKELPGETIEYVWANKVPKGSFFPNPDTNKAIMVAAESGPENTGVWISEARNVYEDYKRLFGAEPPGIAYIAIMTDTDNTGEEAYAWYSDIFFHQDGEK